MKRKCFFASVMTAALFFEDASAQTMRFVRPLSPNPMPPYTTWETAATNINDAVAAASPGDMILVTNGVYDTGGRVAADMTNRLLIDKAVSVLSVNGPERTFIVGRWHNPGVERFGAAAIRCVAMTDGGASLCGFTLTNGTTANGGTEGVRGGGVWAVSTAAGISNCVLAGNAAYSLGGGGYRGAYYNCSIIGNTSSNWAGGLKDSFASNCVVAHNWAYYFGGGEHGSSFVDCRVISNYAIGFSGAYGGGGNGGVFVNCVIQGNTAYGGGGVAAQGNTTSAYNCIILGNVASNFAGGAYNTALYNCLLAGNCAVTDGGGATRATDLYNCTVVGNSCPWGGGGVWGGNVVNSIVYYNSAAPSGGPNWYQSVFTNSCTTPGGTGIIITNEPLFIDKGSGCGTNHVYGNYRLCGKSPCINAGTNMSWMSAAGDWRSRDLDGKPRIQMGIVDIGAYEYIPQGTIIRMRGRK